MQTADSSAKEAEKESPAKTVEAASARTVEKSPRQNQKGTAGGSKPTPHRKLEKDRQRTAGETSSLSKVPIKQKADAAEKKPAAKKTSASTSSTQRAQMPTPSKAKLSNPNVCTIPDKHKLSAGAGAGAAAKSGKSLEASTHQGAAESAPQSPRSPEKDSSGSPSKSPEKALKQSSPSSRLPANPERSDPGQRKRRDCNVPGKPLSAVTKQSSSPVLRAGSNKAPAKKQLKTQSSSPALLTKPAGKVTSDSSSSKKTEALHATPGSRNGPKVACASASQVSKPVQESPKPLNSFSGPSTYAAKVSSSSLVGSKGSDTNFGQMASLPAGVEKEEFDEEKISPVGAENMEDELVFASTRHASAASKDGDFTSVTSDCHVTSSSSTLSQCSAFSSLSLMADADKRRNLSGQIPASESQSFRPIVDTSIKAKAGKARDSAALKARDPNNQPAGNLPAYAPSDEDYRWNGNLEAAETSLPDEGDGRDSPEAAGRCIPVKPSLSHLSLSAESTIMLCPATSVLSYQEQVTDHCSAA